MSKMARKKTLKTISFTKKIKTNLKFQFQDPINVKTDRECALLTIIHYHNIHCVKNTILIYLYVHVNAK